MHRKRNKQSSDGNEADSPSGQSIMETPSALNPFSTVPQIPPNLYLGPGTTSASSSTTIRPATASLATAMANQATASGMSAASGLNSQWIMNMMQPPLYQSGLPQQQQQQHSATVQAAQSTQQPGPRPIQFAPPPTGVIFHPQVPSGAMHFPPPLPPRMNAAESMHHLPTFSPMMLTGAGPMLPHLPPLSGMSQPSMTSGQQFLGHFPLPHPSFTMKNPMWGGPGRAQSAPPGSNKAARDDGSSATSDASATSSTSSLAERKKKRVHIRPGSPSADGESGAMAASSSSSSSTPHGAVRALEGTSVTHTVNNSEFNGEGRLLIHFESFGSMVDPPPRIGKKGVIPNGIKGEFSSYGERWQFIVKYAETIITRQGNPLICIEWFMKNDTWNEYHSIRETIHDAMKREDRGVTLCNRVFTEALEMRAKEYEGMLQEEQNKPNPNQLRIANLMSRIKSLRPRRISEGPLLFGLRHRIVQDHFVQLLASGTVPSAVPATAEGGQS